MWLEIIGVVLALTLPLPARLFAQEPSVKFERIALEEGRTVYCMLQDHQGFLWLGTADGLIKYDGYGFTAYRHDAFDSLSLSTNFVYALCEDRSGTLWVGTVGGGLNRFEREREQFTRFVHDPNNPHSLSFNSVGAIHEDHTGALWIGTADLLSEAGAGLNKFDRATQQFVRFVHDSSDVRSLSHNSVWDIFEDHTGTLWIGTQRGLNKFEREKGQFTHFLHDPDNPNSLSHSDVRVIYEDRARTLWFGTRGGGLNRFDRDQQVFTRFRFDRNNPRSLSQDSVLAISEDQTGALWIGTFRGLNRFDRTREEFARFVRDPNNIHTLSNNLIWSLCQDRSGTLWIGTFFGGIDKFDPGRARFKPFTPESSNAQVLSERSIGGIYWDEAGTRWIGTPTGLARFEHAVKPFAHLFNKSFNSQVNCISGDFSPHGTLWIGTNGNGFYRLDHSTGKLTRFVYDPNDPHSISDSQITAIHQDRFGTLWVGTLGGLNRFDREKERFVRFLHDQNDPYSISTDAVTAICEDSVAQNTLWIATGDGLNRLDSQTGRFTRFLNDPKDPKSLSDNFIWSLHVDHTGKLWVGTNAGLDCFDTTFEKFAHYTTKDGLPSGQIMGILEDDRGRLWVGTMKGLSYFNPETGSFRSYGLTDGLAANEFLNMSHHKSVDGKLFFLSLKGVAAFHPDSITDNPFIPPIVITAFKRYNTGDAEGVAIEEKGISAKKEVTVSYQDNVLNFEFAALSYRNVFKNQYAYKLEGFNDNWIQLGTKHDVTFTNLDPGEYTLRVKGSNNDGVWNEEGTSLKITITPPWWQTRWAYAGYFMLFVAALYGLRRFELNRVKLHNELRMKNFEAEKLHELDHMKSRFFANISHEFRTPLTLILGPVEQMRGKEFKGNLDEAYDMILRNGRRLQRLINQLLDLARLEAGRMSLQARPENIVSFLKGLVLSFASAAERKRIALSISAEEENLIVYFDRDKLEKIVSNLLSNALKFTPEGGQVIVECGLQNADFDRIQKDFSAIRNPQSAIIKISDTGPGIPYEQLERIFDRFFQVDASHTREHEGTGIGLALTKELVELHHGEIFVESEVGRGTTFIVRLPLGNAHLKDAEIANEQSARFEDRGLWIEDRESSIQNQASSNQQQATRNEQPETSDEPILLVVEDNADVRTYIRQYLEPAFKVIEAVDGVEGVQKALEAIPDLIITDVMMPKRDGNELCRILKTDEKTSHVPIIMLTAKADSESKVHGLETGADDYLIKPFDSKELLARVHNLIKQRQQLRERFSREIVLKPQDIAITPRDEVFLNKVKAVVEEYLSDENFEVETLSRKVGMSHSQIHRKLKALTNQSASQFIRSMRLARAVELLKQDAGTVAEIAYQVGFGSQAYFTKCFHEQFGCSPKEYVKKTF
ncbi:response regulator [bacterium]|nr:response regulator [bacterium]